MKRLTYALAAAAMIFAAPAFAQQSAPKPTTLFTNVNVFDGINEKRIMNANVLIEGNLIKEVSTAKIDAPGTKQAEPVGGFWPCAPRARTISEGGSHTDNCRLVWKLASGSVG